MRRYFLLTLMCGCALFYPTSRLFVSEAVAEQRARRAEKKGAGDIHGLMETRGDQSPRQQQGQGKGQAKPAAVADDQAGRHSQPKRLVAAGKGGVAAPDLEVLAAFGQENGQADAQPAAPPVVPPRRWAARNEGGGQKQGGENGVDAVGKEDGEIRHKILSADEAGFLHS